MDNHSFDEILDCLDSEENDVAGYYEENDPCNNLDSQIPDSNEDYFKYVDLKEERYDAEEDALMDIEEEDYAHQVSDIGDDGIDYFNYDDLEEERYDVEGDALIDIEEEDYAHQVPDISDDGINYEENENCFKVDISQDAMNAKEENNVEHLCSEICDNESYEENNCMKVALDEISQNETSSKGYRSDSALVEESNEDLKAAFENSNNDFIAALNDMRQNETGIKEGGELDYKINTCSGTDPLSPQVKQYNQLLSLKLNCLNHIINNFEIFNDAFVNLSSEETLLCRNLTYLQRVFTSHIINGLSKKKLLKEKYISFLINEYLKELDVGIFQCPIEAIGERVAVVGHGLTKVSLFSNNPDLLCHLPNVEVLRFVYCDNDALKSISCYCSKLRYLHIENNSYSLTMDGLKLLCKRNDCQSECLIKVLSIKKLNVHATIISHFLRNVPFLEVLEHTDLPQILYFMHREDLKNNSLKSVKKYNLTKLDICGFNIPEMSDILKVWTEVCPNIRTIRIDYAISEIEFDLFSGFLNLETLVVSNSISSYSPILKQYNNFNTFLKSYGSNLKKLQISNIAISFFDLIESCPKLEDLSLVNIDFQPLESTSVKENISLKNLNKLVLEDLKFSKPCIVEYVKEILLCSPSLNYVLFRNCKLKNSNITTELEKYYKDCTVEFFTFESCDIRLDMLQSIILNCSNLKSLKIDSCKNISSEDVFSLRKLRNEVNSFVVIVFNIYFYYEEDDFDYDFEFDYTIE